MRELVERAVNITLMLLIALVAIELLLTVVTFVIGVMFVPNFGYSSADYTFAELLIAVNQVTVLLIGLALIAASCSLLAELPRRRRERSRELREQARQVRVPEELTGADLEWVLRHLALTEPVSAGTPARRRRRRRRRS